MDVQGLSQANLGAVGCHYIHSGAELEAAGVGNTRNTAGSPNPVEEPQKAPDPPKAGACPQPEPAAPAELSCVCSWTEVLTKRNYCDALALIVH